MLSTGWAGRAATPRVPFPDTHPKEDIMPKHLFIPGFLLAAALAFVAAPDGDLGASSCGGFRGQVCTANESCLNILFYKQCTTRYSYYPSSSIREVASRAW